MRLKGLTSNLIKLRQCYMEIYGTPTVMVPLFIIIEDKANLAPIYNNIYTFGNHRYNISRHGISLKAILDIIVCEPPLASGICRNIRNMSDYADMVNISGNCIRLDESIAYLTQVLNRAGNILVRVQGKEANFKFDNIEEHYVTIQLEVNK